MKHTTGVWKQFAALLLLGTLATQVTAATVELAGYFGDAIESRIGDAQRLSGDGGKIVFVEKETSGRPDLSLTGWLSATTATQADAAKVYLYDIASQTRTLLYQGKLFTTSVNSATVLLSMESGFSVDINADGSKVVMAYTLTTFNAARDRLTSVLKIDLIDTTSLTVTPVSGFAVPGHTGWNVPLRMSKLGTTVVFAFEGRSNTTSSVFGVESFRTSGETFLMTVPLSGNPVPTLLSSSGVSGTTGYNSLINFIGAYYAGFFDISDDGTRVVYQHHGDGKVIGIMSDGSGKREIATLTAGKGAYVSISGDGQTVAYAERGLNSKYAVLYANSFAGGQQREINSTTTYAAGHLILNGDGSNLLYHVYEAGPGGSYGGNSTSYQIATAAGSTPESIAYDLRDGSTSGGKVLTSSYYSAKLFLSTISPLGASTTTTTTTTATPTTTTTRSTTTTTQAGQPTFGNLLINGNAEAGAGSADGSVVAIPGWTVTGEMTVVTYQNTSGFPTLSDPGPVNRGLNFFAGGPSSSLSTMSQLVDVSGAATEIDAAQVSYVLSGFLGGYSSQADRATLSVDFRNAAGTVIGSAAIGPVSNTERNNLSGLLFREATGSVPAGTRSLDVKLGATRVEGTANDGYADNLFLAMTMGTGGGTSTTNGRTTTTTGSTTTTTGSTTTTTLSGGGGATLDVAAGWNLLGNSAQSALNVAAAFGDSSKVTTVWKWVAAKAKWAFYAPALGDGGAAYAAGQGFDFMTSVAGGEGFWVNAKTAFTTSLPSGTAVVSANFQGLPAGWSMIATGDNVTPRAFNNAIGLTPPSAGDIQLNLTSLWAWDVARSNWYFYAPSLDKSGGLGSYITSKSYLNFDTRALTPTSGFWVNKP